MSSRAEEKKSPAHKTPFALGCCLSDREASPTGGRRRGEEEKRKERRGGRRKEERGRREEGGGGYQFLSRLGPLFIVRQGRPGMQLVDQATKKPPRPEVRPEVEDDLPCNLLYPVHQQIFEGIFFLL
jgi:hypothetical protein